MLFPEGQDTPTLTSQFFTYPDGYIDGCDALAGCLERISEALNLAGVAETLYNKDNIPKNLPCAIVILDSETGKNGTSRQ
ncbi:hypothetical protein MASR1M36_11740 [Candidatus Cloacimonadaceae bacterium]